MTRRLAPALVLMLLVAACGTARNGASSEVASAAASASSGAPSATAPASPPGTVATPSPATTTASAEPSVPAALDSDPLHRLVLTDVRTGEELTLGELAAQRPLLLETMAIWCTNCRAQQHNVVAAHDLADFHSLSLDVDPGERPEDLAVYADREGFDWHFAMADAQIVNQLMDRFGIAVRNPPSMPKILFRPDGGIELIGLGELYSAQQIADAVGG